MSLPRRAVLPLLAALLCTPAVQAASAAREWNEELLAAIRRNVPNPPAHARNLFHTATAMYDAWAAYDPTAVGYLYSEKISPLPADIEGARHEAISYATYRILRKRFETGAGTATSLASFDAKLTALGYSTATGQAALTSATTPAELGKRIGQAILTWGNVDGFSQMAYPQAYDAAVNPNMNPVCAMSVLGNNGEFPTRANMPLGVGVPLIANAAQAYTVDTNPNFWQPLALSASVTQNGIPNPGGIQAFIGVQSLATVPFSLTRTDPLKPWIDIGPPSRLSMPGQPSPTDAAYKAGAMDVLRKHAKLNDETLVDFSPGAYGNNPLGADTGTGHAVNPVTNLPYAPNLVKRGDFYRVLAEFWADGPNSETPPGHWHVLANQVADNPLTVKKIMGTGPTLNDLEWDVKTYFSLAAAVHDAACEAWSLKRYYHGTRPITMIRYMGTKGQSSNPAGPSYHTQGLPLEAGVVEVITAATSTPGQPHELIWDVYTNTNVLGANHIGEIVVFSWPAEHPNNLPAPSIATNQSTVRWMFAKDWLPFQRKTFNTPAFPGYTSGHSTFSRAAADALTLLTGSPSFPGGYHHHTVAANSMQIDKGPSAPVDLQWNTYYDAADQAGQSRRWGGIHPSEDDFGGRTTGAQIGILAYTKAEKYWKGTIASEVSVPTAAVQPNGNILVTWNPIADSVLKLQKSTDQVTWTDLTANAHYKTAGSFTDTSATAGTYYRMVATTLSAARVWNEQLMAAIRRNVPNPPAHARNLFHTAVAMYNAWAAYDTTGVGYTNNEKASPLPANIEAARHEAISYAAYRVLRSRFATGAGTETSLASFDAKLTALGYSTAVGQAATTNDPTSPAELGKRIGQAVLNWGAGDGFGNVAYPQAYNAAVNPNMDPARALPVLGNNGEFPSRPNMPLGVGIPLVADPFHGYTADTDPNFWQPLALSTSVTQNGIPTPGGSQTFVGVQGLSATPFSLTRTDPLKPWIDIGPPSRLSMPGQPSATDASYKAGAMDVLLKHAKLNDTTLVNFSPGAYGNNPLGADTGTGHPTNPVTGLPYAANMVQRGNFFRVLAEFWADGPNSETPPGHWHVLANELADNPLTVKKIRGTGPTLNDLEWDVKTYLSLSAATHDAACACWAIKRYYHGARPITMIRYMGTMGQSTNPAGPSYHTQGLPLETDVVEVITAATTTAGAKHELIWNVYTNAYESGAQHIGKIAVFSWPAEHPSNLPAPSIATNQSTVRWMLASDWVPFQRKTFNTPAFPGYVSGHSTFSRAAAEAITLLTGSPSFPGGFGHHTVAANSMQIDLGPSAPVDLQWNTYYDAADQAGQSRRWGGIHPSEDDYPARMLGSQVGKSAFALAEKYWSGAIKDEAIQPAVTILPGGGVKLTWNAVRGMYHKVRFSLDLVGWTDVAPYSLSYANGALPTDSSGTWTDPSPGPGQKYYRILRSTTPP